MLQQLVNIVRLHFLDNDNHKSHCEVRFSTIVDISVLLGLLPTWAGIITPLSSAVCTGIDLIVQHKDPTPSGPDVDSTVKRGAALFFTTTGENDYIIRIPALRAEYYESSGPFAGIRVNIADSDVLSLTNIIISGASTVQPVDIWSNDLQSVTGGIREDY